MHMTGGRQSRPVLTATSQSNGNGQTSTLHLRISAAHFLHQSLLI